MTFTLLLRGTPSADATESDLAGMVNNFYLGALKPDLTSKLDLSPEQNSIVESLRTACATQITTLRNELFQKKTELKALWIQNTPDETKIKFKKKEVRSLRERIQDRIMSYSLELKKILTPEQNSRLAALWLERGNGLGRLRTGQNRPLEGQ